MKQKGILEIKCDQINSKGKAKTDNDYLQEATKHIPELSGSVGITGKQIMNTPFLRGYSITVNMQDGKPKNYIAFVWTLLNKEVLQFLVQSAKKDSINGILGFSPNTCIVKSYKLQAGNPTV